MSSEKKVCLCKGITEEQIVGAIKNGATTVEDVKAKTSATGGACCGARCKGAVEELIENHK